MISFQLVLVHWACSSLISDPGFLLTTVAFSLMYELFFLQIFCFIFS